MIVMDQPHDWGGAFNRRWGPSAHLISDLAGAEGSRELAAFVAAMGVAWAPVQHPGTYREHQDLAGEWLDRARARRGGHPRPRGLRGHPAPQARGDGPLSVGRAPSGL